MSPEQQLREALTSEQFILFTQADARTNQIGKAVGRLLEPIPDELRRGAHDVAVDIERRAMNRYRAWLIGGDE